MWLRTFRDRCTIVALAVMLVGSIALRNSSAQDRFTHGQTIAPAYEGFVANPDGTFDLVFGYLNRNYEEVVDIPVGPANSIEPGGPDQGQPTHFLPRRRRFEFRIRVPRDFGEKELVWTLTVRGKTEKAYGTLKPDYILDNRVMMMNNSGFGQRGNEGDNQPPVVKVEGETRRTVKVGQPVTLIAVITDDGLPAPPDASDRRTAAGGEGATTGRVTRGDRIYGLRGGWYVYRSAGTVTFEPTQTVRPFAPGQVPPPLAKDGRVSVTATFAAPGRYVLRAMGDDMGLQAVQEVTITVAP
jgi:hypothetical protein